MSERRHAQLLREFVGLVAWQVEAHQMDGETAHRMLTSEGLSEQRAQRIVLDAINRRGSWN